MLGEYRNGIHFDFTMNWWVIAFVVIVVILALLVVYHYSKTDDIKNIETWVPSMNAAIPYQMLRDPGTKIYGKDKTSWLPSLEKSFARDYPGSTKRYQEDMNTTEANSNM